MACDAIAQRALGLRVLQWLWVALAVWPVASLGLFWALGVPFVFLDIFLFGLGGGPLSTAFNVVIDHRLWWGGPGAAVFGELGTPVLGLAILIVLLKPGDPVQRRQDIVRRRVGVTMLLASLALMTIAFAIEVSHPSTLNIRYSYAIFPIESVVGEPEANRSTTTTLYSGGRWFALLSSAFFLPLLGAGTRLRSPSASESNRAAV